VKPRRPWLLLVFVLLALGVVAALVLPSGRPVRVRFTRVSRGTVEDTVTSNSVGSVEPVQTAVVSAEVAGRLLRIHVRQGPVRGARTVVEIDSADLKAEREVVRNDVETARARLVTAGLQKKKVFEDLERRRTVDVPRSEVERLERDLEIAKADEHVASRQIKTLEAQLAVLDLRISRTEVRSPFDGTVVTLHAEEGESVVPGKPLFTAHSSSPFLVRAPMDEVDVGRLSLGLPVRVTFESQPDRRFQGVLHEIWPAASTDKKNNRTVDIRIRVPDLPPNVLAGMSANIEVILQAKEDALFLPTHLVQDDREGRGRFVFVAEGGLARRRFVRTGVGNWETVEILEGLGAADVVLMPLRSDEEEPLKDGLRVISHDAGR
jgi:HlyD family secretion protein